MRVFLALFCVQYIPNKSDGIVHLSSRLLTSVRLLPRTCPSVTPGPGWLFIFIGLGIWGTEFTWARRANIFMKHVVLTAWYRYRAWRQQRKERKAARKAERKAAAANQR